tara:strand:- start:5248 stop:5412 length:165 start_codon:yes stop_codon:yes gene_type:complete
VKRPSLKDFTLFMVDKDIFIAVPMGEDGEYSLSLVYLMGVYALKENRLFEELDW